MFFEIHATYEIMWKNIVEPGRAQTAIWRMRIVCWICEAIHTQIMQYAMLATATMVARTRLSVTLYLYFPRFLLFVTDMSAIVLLL